jgi:hypothetical protein
VEGVRVDESWKPNNQERLTPADKVKTENLTYQSALVLSVGNGQYLALVTTVAIVALTALIGSQPAKPSRATNRLQKLTGAWRAGDG